MVVSAQIRHPLGAKPPKEMLTVTREPVPAEADCLDGPSFAKEKLVVRINSSSLELIQTCKRKAMYALKENLRPTEESPATLFGSAIHKGLETWYSVPRATRVGAQTVCGAFSQFDSSSCRCTRCQSLHSYLRVAEGLHTLDHTDKRHPSNGLKILNNYFDHYWDDPFEVYCDKDGPVIERRVEFVIHDSHWLKIIVFGTIDTVLQNSETGTLLVVDHKTTSALGTDFYQRLNPCHQYTLYVMGAQKALGLQTDLFMVNGIQVAKTKTQFARQVTQRTEEHFMELESALKDAVLTYIRAEESGDWPMGSVNSCAMWSGCSYRSICEAPSSIRETIKKNMFARQNAD